MPHHPRRRPVPPVPVPPVPVPPVPVPPSTTAARVRHAAIAADLAELDCLVTGCRACPRLVAFRERVASTKRAAFRDHEYWGRPLPGFGATDARIGILGLAPGMHSSNRTGRVFTGDGAGDLLFAALHRAGLANQPTSEHLGDGLALRGTRIFAAVRCVPPENRPTAAERAACMPWLNRELSLLNPTLRVLVVLGSFAWQAFWPAWRARYRIAPGPRPAFGHGVTHLLSRDDLKPRSAGPSDDERPAPPLALLGCYHVSRLNVVTGRLTPAMLDEVIARAKELTGPRYATERNRSATSADVAGQEVR